MKTTTRTIFFCLLSLLLARPSDSLAQAQFGLIGGYGLYSRYVNPDLPVSLFADDVLPKSSGGIFPLFAGVKVWLGQERISLSLESQIEWNIFALSLKKNDDIEGSPGYGAIDFPFIAKLNFAGLSGLSDFGQGFSIGGGVQWSNTEIYGQTKEYEEGIYSGDPWGESWIPERGGYWTIIVEASYGKIHQSSSAATKEYYIRYGWGEAGASVLHIGVKYSLNGLMSKLF